MTAVFDHISCLWTLAQRPSQAAASLLPHGRSLQPTTVVFDHTCLSTPAQRPSQAAASPAPHALSWPPWPEVLYHFHSSRRNPICGMHSVKRFDQTLLKETEEFSCDNSAIGSTNKSYWLTAE